MTSAIKKIVILGGGTSGWLTAAACSKIFKQLGIELTLVESADIGTIGVGEATIPPIVDFLKYLEIDEKDFLRAVSGTYKLAIKFEDWSKVGEFYYHPFGTVGVGIDGHDFFNCWLRARDVTDVGAYHEYSPAANMCEFGNFYNPNKAPPDSFLAGASYAWHFDAHLVANYMRAYSEANGVKRVEGRVVSVQQSDNFTVKQLQLSCGTEISGDFFIDCSGFVGLLIDKHLHQPFEDWSGYLPCDRALACPTASDKNIPPYTISKALSAGWMWSIPLQNRVGNGYVYSSKFISDEQAETELLNNLKTTSLSDPRLIKFKSGVRKRMWFGNCLSLGLSAGFVEPLESTAIHLVMKGVRTFLELFPNSNCQKTSALQCEYQRVMEREYTDIRDFIVLHYFATQRTDTDFWSSRRCMTIPSTLAERIELFLSRGVLYLDSDNLFKRPSWYSVFTGMGLMPRTYNPLVGSISEPELVSAIAQVRSLMQTFAKGLPDHSGYLKKFISN